MTNPATGLVSVERHYAVEQFLYREAALLDEHRYHDWIALFEPDIHYWMPIRSSHVGRAHESEFAPPDGAAWFDEDHASLALRIKRLDTGRAWAEEPRSRTRHLISNIRVTALTAGELAVQCCFALYRSRGESQVDLFVGRREDLLRETADPANFKIARRSIYLDQTLLHANNLSIFF